MSKVTPLRLRQQLVHAYNTGLVNTYDEAAEMFGVGRATVSRLLRQYRETQCLVPSGKRGHRPRADSWLLEQGAEETLRFEFGDARVLADANIKSVLRQQTAKAGHRSSLQGGIHPAAHATSHPAAAALPPAKPVRRRATVTVCRDRAP